MIELWRSGDASFCENRSRVRRLDARNLARQPRFHMHFTPTSSSWLNLVERWFREITTKRIRRGSFRSVEQLERTIQDFIDEHNQSPGPFVWTADLKDILPRILRAHGALDTIKNQ